MSWTRVQGAAVGGSGTVASLTANLTGVTVGNILCVGVVCSGLPAVTIADGSNVYTLQKDISGSSQGLYIFTAPVLVGGSLTVVATPASSFFMSMTWAEYSFTSGATVSLDGTPAAATGSTTLLASGDVTITTPDLAFGVGHGNATIQSAANGFTIRSNQAFVGGTTLAIADADILNAASSPIEAEFNSSGSTATTCAAIGLYAPTPNVYQASISAITSLIGYWPMNEISSGLLTAWDVKSSRHGTISTGGTAPTVDQAGLPSGGGSYLFNGNTSTHLSYVETPAFEIGGVAGLSMECWIYFTSGRAAQTAQIMGYTTVGGGAYSGLLEMLANNSLTFSIVSNASPIASTGVLTSGTWHHIVITGAVGGALTMYVDGVAQASPSTITTPYNMANTLPLFIGGGGVYAFDSTFQISNVAVYNAPLTSTQVGLNYNAGLLVPVPPVSTYPAALLCAG